MIPRRRLYHCFFSTEQRPERRHKYVFNGVRKIQTKDFSLSPAASPQDENKGGKEGEGGSEADRGTEEEEGAEAGGTEEERPEEADLVHQERGQLPVFPAGQPRLQLPHHGPQSGPAAAAHVHSQVGQEEQGAQVRHQVHEVPPVSHLSHCLPVTRLPSPEPRPLSDLLLFFIKNLQRWSSFYICSFKYESGRSSAPNHLLILINN